MQTILTFYVALDPKLQEAVAWLIGLLFTFVLLQITNTPALKWLADYLGAYKVGIVAWFTNITVQLIQAGLDKIIPAWDNVAVLAMQLLAAVILTLAGFAFWRRQGWKGNAALR